MYFPGFFLEHCQEGNHALFHQVMFDWLDEVFHYNILRKTGAGMYSDEIDIVAVSAREKSEFNMAGGCILLGLPYWYVSK